MELPRDGGLRLSVGRRIREVIREGHSFGKPREPDVVVSRVFVFEPVCEADLSDETDRNGRQGGFVRFLELPWEHGAST